MTFHCQFHHSSNWLLTISPHSPSRITKISYATSSNQLPIPLIASTSSSLGNESTSLMFTHSNTPSSARNASACTIDKPCSHVCSVILNILYTPMSNANMSNKSPHSSPPDSPASYHLPHTLAPNDSRMLPNTVATILATQPSIDTITLRSIAKGLVETIKEREERHRHQLLSAHNRYQQLEDKLANYEEGYNTAPNSYKHNINYPDLRIPIGEGLYHPAKWIKMADQGMLLAYTKEQGPESDPYLVPIHAAPIFSSEPIDPIPQWLHQLLIGQSAIFHMLVNAAKKLDNWGVAADITCYQEYNDEMADINACIEQLQARADSVRLAKLLCKGWLEVARAPKQLAHMECLALVFMHHKRNNKGPQVAV